jgi:lipoyl(octanoyl) transferase
MVKYSDWGLTDYLEAWKRQEAIFNAVIKAKTKNLPTADLEEIIFCEHPHVYTLGKSGNESNLLIQGDFLRQIGATYYKIDRGGDITYHGPGQLVGYPILDLENHNLSLKQYIHNVEEAIIQTIAHYGIRGERLLGATGVWLDADKSTARKICAVGVRASRFTTMHGFALNVNTHLQYFNYINPCGFTTKGVSSLEKELGMILDMEEIKMLLLSYLQKKIE